jgi:hypothetical protein
VKPEKKRLKLLRERERGREGEREEAREREREEEREIESMKGCQLFSLNCVTNLVSAGLAIMVQHHQ